MNNEMGSISVRGIVLMVALLLPFVFAGLIPSTVELSITWSTLYRAGLMACLFAVLLSASLTGRETVAGMFIYFLLMNGQHVSHLEGQSAYTFRNAALSGLLFITVFVVALFIMRKRVSKRT